MENQSLEQQELRPTAIAGLAEEAAERISNLVSETDLFESNTLSHETARVFVKDETSQAGGSFKDRGAGNAVLYHAGKGDELVVTASAGNHGRGVARAASEESIDSVVVVPSSASDYKKEAILRSGAELIAAGQNFDEALAYGLQVAEERNARFIHPYADPLVIAGQATIGLEILKQAPDMTHLVLPVGGGGMLAGVASVIKEHREDIKVIAAQVSGNSAFVDSLSQGKPLKSQDIDKRFEGIAVGNVHPMTFDIAKSVVDSTVILDTGELDRTLYNYREEHGTLLELAGAVSPAAAQYLAQTALSGEDAKIVAIASGANPPRAFSGWLDARARRLGWS